MALAGGPLSQGGVRGRVSALPCALLGLWGPWWCESPPVSHACLVCRPPISVAPPPGLTTPSWGLLWGNRNFYRPGQA